MTRAKNNSFSENLQDGSKQSPTNDGVEDTEHYLLLWHTYDTNRLDILSGVNAIFLRRGLINLSNKELLKIILYGYEQIPFDSNAKILTTTLEYIQASKRFE